MQIIRKIKNRAKWLLAFPMDYVYRVIYPTPTVKSIEETLKKIIEDHCSVSRYGDGELNIMIGKDIDFQNYVPMLADKMKTILKNDDEKYLVCLPDTLIKNNNCDKYTREWWARFMRAHRKDWGKLLKPGKVYYNTCITRFYMRYVDKSRTEVYVQLLKKIWDNRKIIMVEGEMSRLGVGNDLFDNATSIRRILCPAENAFEHYDEIIRLVEQYAEKDEIILIALGPTATVLAYDLYKLGYQAIDIGHVDIEYEWYRMGAVTKVAVKNKYTNEALDGKSVGEYIDKKYEDEIIAVWGDKKNG